MRVSDIKMKACTVFLTTLMLLIIVQETSAQYDEICHWQCDVIHCDFFSDYCDYDCYEVCYPLAANSRSTRQVTVGRVPAPQRIQPARILTTFSASTRGKQFSIQTTKPQEGMTTGKTVRMRIENPTFQSVQRGRVVATRGSTPRSFALMQTCLSKRAEKTSMVSMAKAGTKHDDSVLLQPTV